MKSLSPLKSVITGCNCKCKVRIPLNFNLGYLYIAVALKKLMNYSFTMGHFTRIVQVCENEMLARGVAAFEEAKAEAALEDPKAKKKRER